MIEIVLPLPDKRLSPNARCHWAEKARITKNTRRDSYWATFNAIAGTPPKWKTATAQATFYFRDNRRRDKDNFAASLKSHADGMKDAGLILDDCGLTWLPPIFAVDKENPRLVLRVTPAGDWRS